MQSYLHQKVSGATAITAPSMTPANEDGQASTSISAFGPTTKAVLNFPDVRVQQWRVWLGRTLLARFCPRLIAQPLLIFDHRESGTPLPGVPSD